MDDKNACPGLPRPYVYYVEFYIKLTFADKTNRYFHYETAAGKPLTEDFLAKLLAETWAYQADIDPTETVTAAQYVTRAEWETVTEGVELQDLM